MAFRALLLFLTYPPRPMLKKSPIKLGTIIGLTTLVGAELPSDSLLSSNPILKSAELHRSIAFKKKNIDG